MPDTPPPTPTPTPEPTGKYLGWLTAVKGLTITNAVVIIMLAIVVIPGYILYRTINDEKLIERFMSSYREISSQQTGCTERIAQQKGGATFYSVSTGFAYQGSDRWVVSVWMDHDLTADQIISYCETLKLIVDFMRDPQGTSPLFPNSDEPVVRQYAPER